MRPLNRVKVNAVFNGRVETMKTLFHAAAYYVKTLFTVTFGLLNFSSLTSCDFKMEERWKGKDFVTSAKSVSSLLSLSSASFSSLARTSDRMKSSFCDRSSILKRRNSLYPCYSLFSRVKLWAKSQDSTVLTLAGILYCVLSSFFGRSFFSWLFLPLA